MLDILATPPSSTASFLNSLKSRNTWKYGIPISLLCGALASYLGVTLSMCVRRWHVVTTAVQNYSNCTSTGRCNLIGDTYSLRCANTSEEDFIWAEANKGYSFQQMETIVLTSVIVGSFLLNMLLVAWCRVCCVSKIRVDAPLRNDSIALQPLDSPLMGEKKTRADIFEQSPSASNRTSTTPGNSQYALLPPLPPSADSKDSGIAPRPKDVYTSTAPEHLR